MSKVPKRCKDLYTIISQVLIKKINLLQKGINFNLTVSAENGGRFPPYSNKNSSQIYSKYLAVCHLYSAVIRCFRSSINSGFIAKILFFKCPQRKDLNNLNPGISVATQLDLVCQSIEQENCHPKTVLEELHSELVLHLVESEDYLHYNNCRFILFT